MQPLDFSQRREALARVNVVGTSGSGKSTVARALADIFAVPCIELDALYWGPCWIEVPMHEFQARLSNALSSHPNWVIDGNYDSVLDLKWKNATAVVWIDYSFARTLWQAVNRAVARIIKGRELWPGTGNRETFVRTFMSRDSILLWTIQTHGTQRKRYSARMRDPQFSHLVFIRLRSPKETRLFLSSLCGPH